MPVLTIVAGPNLMAEIKGGIVSRHQANLPLPIELLVSDLVS